MATQKIILFSSGTFNPPTIMHLRIFELARDYLHKLGGYEVIGGILSPVHDRYGKKDMVNSSHRFQMLKLAMPSSPWLKISNWEIGNEDWTRTRLVMEFHQSQLNSYANGSLSEKEPWMPDTLSPGIPVKLKLLCGADYLESFNVPNLWTDADMQTLARDFGLVVISREGNDPTKSIYKSDILTEFERNIILVKEWIFNDVSSTKIRQAIRRNQSIRYFVPDEVIEYIQNEGLYSNKN